MPTYEYKCTECGHCFEVIHGVHDNVEECEACGSKVRRVFHPVGVIFKGSGFYSTDNRSKSGNGGKVPSSAEAGSSDKKADEPKVSVADKLVDKTEKTGTTEKAGKSDQA